MRALPGGGAQGYRAYLKLCQRSKGRARGATLGADLKFGALVEPDTTDWRAMALVVVGGVTAAMHVGKAAIAMPVLQSSTGPGWRLSAGAAAWLLALPGLVGCLGAVAVGAWLRRIQPRTAFASALFGAAVAAFVGAGADSTVMLLGARAVEASCGLVVMVAAPVVLATFVAPHDRLLALGVWGAYMPFGQALVVVAGGWIVHAYDWPALWMATALASLGTGVGAVLLRLPRTGHEENLVAEPGPARRRDWVRPALLGAIFMTYAFQWIALTGYLPTLLTDLDVTLTATGLLTALVLAGNVAGNLVAGVLGSHGVPGGSLLAAALSVMLVSGALVFTTATPVESKVAAAFVFSTCGGVVPGTLFGLVGVPGPIPASRRNALLVQGSQLGAALGPLLVAAAVAAGGGWHGAVPLMVIAGLCSLALCSVWSRGGSVTRRSCRHSTVDPN